MLTLGNVLMMLNVIIALGTIISGVISWARGGFVSKAIDSIQKIDRIEKEVNEINRWKDDIEVMMIAMSKNPEKIDEQEVLERFDRDIGYEEFMELQNGTGDDEKITKGD